MMTQKEKDDLQCDVLLFFAVATEQRKLREVSKQIGVPFQQRTINALGDYFYMGTIGGTKVNAVRTEMGPFSYGGSASRAIHFRIATDATGIVQLGMAFGIDRDKQSIGDVLVSTAIFPYDLRIVRPGKDAVQAMPRALNDQVDDDGGTSVFADDAPAASPTTSSQGAKPPYHVDYSRTVWHESKKALVNLFEAERNRSSYPHLTHFGGLLSGGARIYSKRFLDELIAGVPAGDGGIVGGEMEGVGLLSVSPADDPIWIVVKGISDFADDRRDETIKNSRPVACENSVRFVLEALKNA